MADTQIPAELLDTDELFRLLAEVDRGVGADQSRLPDTPVVREWRALLVAQVAAIKARGGAVEIPYEI